jgi:hypothetical protein
MARDDQPQVRSRGTMPVHERLLRTDSAYVRARLASENRHLQALDTKERRDG